MVDILALAVGLLALLISVISVALALYFGPTPAMNHRITTTESDLTELADRVHHWMRRDSVRKVRDKFVAENLQPVESPTSSPKAALFARARAALRGNSHESAR